MAVRDMRLRHRPAGPVDPLKDSAHAPSRHRHTLRVELEVPFKPPSRSMAVGLWVGEVRVDQPQFVHEQLERSGTTFK
jgi:hypothetical protein